MERFACIDYRNHLALLAEVFEDGRETMIGEARYVVDERDPEMCEFAIAVADDWQARGIASAMLDRLERQAASSGIRRMVADTLITNRAMIRLAGRTGYVVRASRKDASVARLEKVLSRLRARRRPPDQRQPEQITTIQEQPNQRRKTMTVKSNNPETMALHAGPRRDAPTGAVAVPIYQTTSYEFRNTEHASNLFALKDFGNIYSRIMNPTCDVLEQRIAALEGGVAALAVSSGQAASVLSIQNLCRPGDNIVSSTDLYGGTWNLFANTLPSMGITVRFVDPADPEAFRRATDERTRAYYAETLPNPKLTVFPIGEVAAIGRELGVPLIMDNTAAALICRPFDHGAAIIVHSTTKYIGGHGTSIGGIIVDGGNFDWAAHKQRFPTLNEADPSYHGAVWTEVTKPMGPLPTSSAPGSCCCVTWACA